MTTTTTAQEITRFLVKEYPDKGAMWVMKVVYYIQGWRLAWDGAPAFTDPIEAWDHGPVAPAAYDTFYAIRGRATEWSLPQEIEAVARAVADFYSKYSGGALKAATHDESPWTTTYGTQPSFNTRGTNPIIEEGKMRTYFTQHAALSDDTPVRPVTGAQDQWDVDLAEVDAFTKPFTHRWSDALELLAR